MVQPKTFLIPRRGVSFSRASPQQHASPGHNDAQDATTPSHSETTFPDTSSHNTTSSTAVIADSSSRDVAIEEYLCHNPQSTELRQKESPNYTPEQSRECNKRQNECHQILFRHLAADLRGLDLFGYYEQGKYLATLVVNVRPGATRQWIMIRRKIERVFAGFGDTFEHGWELTDVVFAVTE